MTTGRLVAGGGFEPPTSWLCAMRAAGLLYLANKKAADRPADSHVLVNQRPLNGGAQKNAHCGNSNLISVAEATAVPHEEKIFLMRND